MGSSAGNSASSDDRSSAGHVSIRTFAGAPAAITSARAFIVAIRSSTLGTRDLVSPRFLNWPRTPKHKDRRAFLFEPLDLRAERLRLLPEPLRQERFELGNPFVRRCEIAPVVVIAQVAPVHGEAG
jgi:hypothetical protein